MNTVISILKSRTVWTVLIMMATAQIQIIQPLLTVEQFVLVQAILAALASYFRVTPKQNY